MNIGIVRSFIERELEQRQYGGDRQYVAEAEAALQAASAVESALLRIDSLPQEEPGLWGGEAADRMRAIARQVLPEVKRG